MNLKPIISFAEQTQRYTSISGFSVNSGSEVDQSPSYIMTAEGTDLWGAICAKNQSIATFINVMLTFINVKLHL